GGVRGRAWAGRAASAGAVWFPVARRLARWPRPRRPITSAAAWWPVAVGWCSRSGPSQCSAPHREVYAGSTTMTGRPALLAIWTSRSRKRGRDAGDRAPEAPAAPAAAGAVPVTFASLGTGPGEVQVLDDDGAGTAGQRGRDEAADGCPQVPVAGGGGEP